MNKKSIDSVREGYIDFCQICGSNDLQQVIDMGFHAPCDSLLTKEMLKIPEKTYPLKLVRCRECGLVQIDYVVDTKELFYPAYPYRSGITETLRKNLHGISSHMVSKLCLQKNSLVVDIGSNDGTILEGFKNIGMRVFGVEPTDIADIANHNGIETLKEFFSLDAAKKIVDKYGKASVVTAANVFAHISGLFGLIEGVDYLLEDEGVFITESHYQLDILKTLQYDSIYHEHLRYYLIKPLIRLFNNNGFTLIDVERIPNYGGSIRVYAKKGLNHPVSENVDKLIDLENKDRTYDEATYEEFSLKIQLSRKKLRSLMISLAQDDKKVVGIGCPGRCATLLTYCGITPDLLPYIAEQETSLKLGMFTPCTHIPVEDEALMLKEQPEYALILSWHYAQPIIKTLRAKGLRSKIIIPLPEINIIE
jgi:hypothetical protein